MFPAGTKKLLMSFAVIIYPLHRYTSYSKKCYIDTYKAILRWVKPQRIRRWYGHKPIWRQSEKFLTSPSPKSSQFLLQLDFPPLASLLGFHYCESIPQLAKLSNYAFYYSILQTVKSSWSHKRRIARRENRPSCQTKLYVNVCCIGCLVILDHTVLATWTLKFRHATQGLYRI